MWSHWNSHILLVEKKKNKLVHFVNCLVNYEGKIYLPHYPQNPLQGIFPRQIKTYALKNTCYKNVYYSFVYNTKNWK